LIADIIGNLNNEFFIYVQNSNDSTNRAITDIITNINLPIPSQEPSSIQNINAVQEVVTNNTLKRSK